ncbi:hypothetical protein O6P43_012189 [Quillaja saponaria]|uniref:HAT C-terminal dimerisation domain-containing protein n=1 Tax=Quillaja saponaria TaxID=32244 RepID=A0AAD7PV60_QUISA|nr:hypothetical protein O6P43_012189 [Quillaja saponaria]
MLKFTNTQSSLSPKTVEAFICLENWLSPSTSTIEAADALDYLVGSLSIEEEASSSMETSEALPMIVE